MATLEIPHCNHTGPKCRSHYAYGVVNETVGRLCRPVDSNFERNWYKLNGPGSTDFLNGEPTDITCSGPHTAIYRWIDMRLLKWFELKPRLCVTKTKRCHT